MTVPKKTWFLFFVMAILLICIDCGEVVPQQAVIKINPAEKFQTMTGWEATSQSGESYSPAFENYRDQLISLAVNDLGINRLRLEIRSGAENPKDYFSEFDSKKISEEDWEKHNYEVINDNDDPFVINPKGFQFSELDSSIERIILPFRKKLAERGESLFVNLNFVAFNGKGVGNSNLAHQKNPEEYAELILAAFQHIQTKYGFVPDAVEVILEPDNNTGWTGADIGKAIVATAKRLRENNFKPGFIAPSTTSTANAPIFIDEIAKIPDAMQYVTEFSYHRYNGASEEVLRAIADRAIKYGKKTAMLEWMGADYQALHEDLKIGRNSAWQQFTLAFPISSDNGAQYFLVDDRNPKNPVITMGSRTKFLRQYFYYIRSGARRIGAETTNKNFDPLAFINTSGKYVVVVKADVPGTVEIQGLPAGTFGISYAVSNRTEAGGADLTLKAGETLKAAIPSIGVLTVFQK